MTPAFLQILLCLVDREKHGYAIMQEAAERTRGSVQLGPGSLYWALGRLQEAGLIEECTPDEIPAEHDERRRYYRLTADGRERLKKEMLTLDSIVSWARQKQVLP